MIDLQKFLKDDNWFLISCDWLLMRWFKANFLALRHEWVGSSFCESLICDGNKSKDSSIARCFWWRRVFSGSLNHFTSPWFTFFLFYCSTFSLQSGKRKSLIDFVRAAGRHVEVCLKWLNLVYIDHSFMEFISKILTSLRLKRFSLEQLDLSE